jgi:protein TonB
MPKDIPKTPVTAKTRQVVRQSAQKPLPPEPATQPEGTVPVFADPKKTQEVPTDQTSQAGNGVPGGTGSGSGSSQGSGRGGGGTSTEQLRSKYRSEHFAYIKKIIERNIVYPDRAKRLGWTGRCIVNFVVMENGQVKDIGIQKSTGYNLLDDNVVETIRKVEPFPRPPVSVKLTIPLTYSLE